MSSKRLLGAGCSTLVIALAVCLTPRESAGVAYTWADAGTAWGTAGNWTPGGGPPNSLTADTAIFANDATISNQPSLSGGTFAVSGISFDNTGADYNPTGTTGLLTIGGGGLTLTGGGVTSSSFNVAIGANQAWDVSAGGTFVQTGSFSGANSVTKSNSGTLLFNNATATPNTFAGDYTIRAGTLQGGNDATRSSQVLRSNAINIFAGATLTNAGANGPDFSVGQLTGSGTATSNVSSTKLRITVLSDANFAGTVSLGGTAGLSVYGAKGATQTLSGNATGVAGNATSTISSATLRLTGGGDTTSGVLGTNASNGLDFTMRGGKLLLDNSNGNTLATNGRLNNSDNFVSLGGTVAMIGHSSGSAETVNGLTMNAGGTTVQVTNTAGGTGAQLTFSAISRTSGVAGTINFVGDGSGTLGSAGDNPRVVFTSAPGLTNGVIANSGGSGILGFATVNGRDFATYAAGTGVAAVSSTSVSGALATAPTQNSVLTVNGSIAGANVSYNTLKIAPSAGGQSLDLTGAGNLNTAGILLTGTTDFTIQNTGGGTGGLTAGNQRFITVSDPNTTLNISTSLVSSNNALTKGGEGILALTGSSSQIVGANATNFGINAGVLRGSLTSLGGGTSSDGDFTTIQLRGGVLEISGGGMLSRSLDQSGNGSGGGITFDEGATDQGGGGFSAINGNATVTFVTAIGGATPSSPTSTRPTIWGNGNFVPSGHALQFGSVKADSSVTLTNGFALDTNTAGNTTEYVAREIRVADNANSTTDRAVLSGEIVGSAYADLLKTGAGTLELSFASGNTYRGNTLVVGGTLLASNTSGSATGSGLVKVSIDGTLGGNGLITGPVVADSGGKVSPGESIGNLGVGSLTFKGGSALVYEVDTTNAMSPSADLLNGIGELNIESGVTLTLDDIAAVSNPITVPTKFTLIRYESGKWNGGTFAGTTDGGTVTIEANTFVIDYDDTSGGVNFGGGTAGGSYVTLTAQVVPEPGAFLFGVVVCSLAGVAHCRRKRLGKQRG